MCSGSRVGCNVSYVAAAACLVYPPGANAFGVLATTFSQALRPPRDGRASTSVAEKVLPSRFFDQIHDSRQPFFAGKAMHGRKKFLKTCEPFFSFDFHQRSFVPLPRCMPAPRDQGSICADVFVFQQAKS